MCVWLLGKMFLSFGLKRHGSALARWLCSRPGESSEETLGIPLRTLRRISDPLCECKQDMIELGGGSFVHRLLEIVGRGVVAVFQPFFMQLLLGRVWFVTEAEDQSGDSQANKAVLIGADEDVPVSLRVGLHLHSEGRTNGMNIIPQSGFAQTKNAH